MTKAELIAAIATQTGLSKKNAAAAVDAFTNSVANALKKGEKVQLVGFGSFVREQLELDVIHRQAQLYRFLHL